MISWGFKSLYSGMEVFFCKLYNFHYILFESKTYPRVKGKCSEITEIKKSRPPSHFTTLHTGGQTALL